MAEGWRKQVLGVAERVGAEPVLRRLQRSLANAESRRDMRDMEHLRLLMRLSLRLDANCVDLGANVGDVLGEMVLLAPHGHHVAFEPLPDLADDLRRRFPGVDVHNTAVAAARHETTFYRVKDASTRSSLSKEGLDGRELEAIQVHVQTLDEALQPDYAPALIKIDVEGAESQVFAGAQRVLSEHMPLLVFEHGQSATSSADDHSEKIHTLLSKFGYRIFDIDGTGPLSLAQFQSLTAAGKIWTFVAHG
jgi:FkbM family methyltransferase